MQICFLGCRASGKKCQGGKCLGADVWAQACAAVIVGIGDFSDFGEFPGDGNHGISGPLN